MKKVIIVAPHFPPSNLAAVHRSRLFAKHLPAFGWEPIIVTVDEAYYEEKLDWNLHELLPAGLRIEKVNALPVRPVKVVGDIGIRGFFGMYHRILKIIKNENADFLFIPIPSNYAAVLGRLVHDKTGIPYGIDYIDPWVGEFPGTNKFLSKAWFSKKLADWLEPFAVKKTSLITGVAPGYYDQVFDRNPKLKGKVHTSAMPYGGEISDHLFVKEKQVKPYLFKKEEGVIDMVYAGAMLPKAFGPLKQVISSLSENREIFKNVRFHFIGTGTSPNDPNGFNIKPLAEKANIFNSIIFEYPNRIPYLDVLAHLEAADGIFILGSTEAHYTPSKVFQGVLSGKPLFAILHRNSSACKIITETNAGVVLSFEGEKDLKNIHASFFTYWNTYERFLKNFEPSQVDLTAFDNYSAKNVTGVLASALANCLT